MNQFDTGEVAQLHKFRVYIEGIQVPATSATINIQVDQPTTVQLSLPPAPAAFNILPRSLVHIFWWERGAWRLLFEGEAVTRGYQYSAGQRSAVVGCQDLTTYWQEAYRLFFSLTGKSTVDNRKLYAINPNAAEAVTTMDGMVEVGNVLEEAFSFGGSDASGVLARALSNVFSFLEGINTYFRWGIQRTKILNKIKTIDNETAMSILREMGGIFNRGLSAATSNEVTLWSLMQVILGYINYNLISNPAPAYIPPTGYDYNNLLPGIGGLSQIVLQPEVYFAQPPRCNVILPPLFTQFSFREDWMSQPTRTIITQDLGVQVPRMTFYAPSELEDYMGNMDNRRQLLLDEEKLRGMKIVSGNISSAEVRGQSEWTSLQGEQGQVSDANIRRLTAQMVNYQHHRARFAARNGSGTGPFNPFLVPGLPAALVDRTAGHLVGDLSQVTHQLDFANGLAHTSFTLSHVRWIGLPFNERYMAEWQTLKENDYPEGLFGENGKPSWFDDSFGDDKIGETLYQAALGYTDEYFGGVKQASGDGTLETMEEALDRVRHQSLVAEDPLVHAMRYARRELATEFETFLALGAEVDDDEKVKELQDAGAELGEATLWSVWRKYSIGRYRNPGNQSMSYRDDFQATFTPNEPEGNQGVWDLTDVKGPFISERQEWARAFLRETESGVAYAF